MNKTIMTMGTTEAANRCNCSYKTIIFYCKIGKLKGWKNPVTGRWLIDAESVEDLLASGVTKK